MDTYYTQRRQTVGILGGMGPLATADLMIKIIEETPAGCDQEHVPVVVTSLPQMPSRIDAIVANGPTPLPALRDALRRLECAGAEVIAMPCNTAHFWYDDLCRSTRLPFLHIVDSALAGLSESQRRIGVLASSATVKAGIYSTRLRAGGRKVIEPGAEWQAMRVDAAIAAVKAGRIGKAATLLAPVAERLVEAGADAIVLGCTEFPIAFRDQPWAAPVPLIDATRALARACVTASSPAPAGFVWPATPPLFPQPAARPLDAALGPWADPTGDPSLPAAAPAAAPVTAPVTAPLATVTRIAA